MGMPIRRAKLAGILAGCAATILLAVFLTRALLIAGLAREARLPGYPYPKAIDRLSGFHGKRATAALLSVAVDDEILDENRAAAMRALLRRSGREISVALAAELRPDEDLYLREAVSDVLSQRECGSECEKFILEYLERRSWGEKTGEENLDPRLIDPREAELERRLRSILLTDPERLRSVLAERFGIRKKSRTPSLFAIKLIATLNLKSSCSELQSTHEELQQLHARNQELLSELTGVEQQLSCPKSTDGEPRAEDHNLINRP